MVFTKKTTDKSARTILKADIKVATTQDQKNSAVKTYLNSILSSFQAFASAKTAALIDRLGKYTTKTLTADNGAENTNHQEIARVLQLFMYFFHAYHSWEKGTVENTNGRIRRYIPKGVSIDTISEEYIAALENKLNNTPRKCLQYLTPYEKMHKLRITTT